MIACKGDTNHVASKTKQRTPKVDGSQMVSVKAAHSFHGRQVTIRSS